MIEHCAACTRHAPPPAKLQAKLVTRDHHSHHLSQETAAAMHSPGFVALVALISVVGMMNLLPQSVAFCIIQVPPTTAVSTSTTENVNYPRDRSSSSSSRRFDCRHFHHRRGDGAAMKMAGRGGEGQEETAVTRGGFLVSFATIAVGAGTMLGAVGVLPEEASATGMLDFPPAKLNNRCVLISWSKSGDRYYRRHIDSSAIKRTLLVLLISCLLRLSALLLC